MSRWTATALVGAASSSAAAYVPSSSARIVLVSVAAISVIMLACWGAKSEIRVEEAHQRILDLSEQLASTAETAEAAHAQAYRPVAERRAEEDYELIVKPIDELMARAWGAIRRFVTGGAAQANELP
jgi:hypothetical protein